MKNLKLALLAAFLLGTAHASYATTTAIVSHSTFSVQNATISVPLGRIDDLRVGTITVTNPFTFNTLNMSGTKIINVATGTATGDAPNIGQLAFINVSSATRIQTVSASSTTTSTAFVSTVYTLTYKLNVATDRVMGFVCIPAQMTGTVASGSGVISYTRDGVDQTAGGAGFLATTLEVSGVTNNANMSGFFIDNPGDTNFHTYTLTFKVSSASDTLNLNVSNIQGQFMLTETRPNP